MDYMFSMLNILRSTFSNMCLLCSCALIYIEIVGGDGSVYDIDCDDGFTVVYVSPNTSSCTC